MEVPAEDIHPAWSPDGTKIVFLSQREGGWGMYVVALGADRHANYLTHWATVFDPRLVRSFKPRWRPARVLVWGWTPVSASG